MHLYNVQIYTLFVIKENLLVTLQVPPNYLRIYDIQKHIEEQLETSVLEINFIVTLQHFIKGRLKVNSVQILYSVLIILTNFFQLKCSARIHRIYHAETEKFIEEDRPRILASGRSPETFPYDHNDEFDDENGLYLTHYKSKTTYAFDCCFCIIFKYLLKHI